MKRKCQACRKVKSLSQFNSRGDGYFRTKCRSCFKTDAARYKANQDPVAVRAYRDDYYKKNGAKSRAKRIDRYHADPKARTKVLTQSQLYYQKNKVAVNARLKRYRVKLKAEVIAAYGGKCSCLGGCPETEPDFLTVEHIGRDGKDHRQRVTSVYRDLRDRGYPKKGYTIHCFNCNIAKSLFGSCPHERKHDAKTIRCS